MGILNRDAILSAHDIREERVFVPEWHGEVIVRGLAGWERDEYEQSLVDLTGGKARVSMRNARARLVAMATVDENGTRLFSEQDIPMLSQKNASALDRIWEIAAKLSGLGDNDYQAMGNDSKPGLSADSTSA
jgi:hypothetical protein